MRQIIEHEVVVHGVEHEQYWQGCCVSGTRFNLVATGIGDDAAEAFEDALDALALAGWDIEGACDWADVPHAGDHDQVAYEHEVGDIDECHFYVSVRVR